MRVGLFSILSFVILSGFTCGASDPLYTKAQFSQELAVAVCQWADSCCDSGEITDQPGAGVQGACESSLTGSYSTWLEKVSVEDFREDDARACVKDFAARAAACPKGFDADEYLKGCKLVASTLQAGDTGCTDDWQCSTGFCKSGICANPLGAGADCASGERCQSDLRCVGGRCAELQPDGATCIDGPECFSGTCGGGRCVVSSTYTCDGK